MTLPASGQIGFSDINTEKSTASAELSWSFIKSRTKPVDTINSLNGMYGLVWQQRDNVCVDAQPYFQAACNCNCACDCSNCACTGDCP